MNALKSARLEKGWTQQQAADELKITKASYANIERGARKPSLKIAIKIQKLFQIPIDIFVEEIGGGR